jgi:purine-nucleoside phosphorylase
MTSIDPAEASSYIQSYAHVQPSVGLVLGSGWGGIAKQVRVSVDLPFSSIPGFQTTHAQGHEGRLLLGQLENVPVLVMAGRFHRYEGYTTQQVTFPIEVMSLLGITELIITNAAGGVHPKLKVGDIVIVKDHINWLGGIQPAFQKNFSPVASSTPARQTTDLYDDASVDRLLAIANSNHINARIGTYLATLGPSYETRSEYRMMRKIGADVVGMSSIPEAMAAKHLGISPLVLSIVTNVANPDQKLTVNHDEVLEVGRNTESNAEKLIRGFLKSLKGKGTGRANS